MNRDTVLTKSDYQSWQHFERLLRAIEREWPNDPASWPMELHCCRARTFRCELCGRRQAEEKRREPGSEICAGCVRDAGFSS